MKVLFVAPVVPWPADAGGRLRTSNLLRELGRRAELHLRCVRPPDAAAEAPAELRAACASLEVFERDPLPLPARWMRTRAERWFHSTTLREALARDLATGDFDLVHLDEPCLVRALPTHPGVPVCVHHHKLDRELAAALPAPNPLRRWLEDKRLATLERLALRRFPDQLLCSAEDAARLGRRAPAARCQVVPSGFDPGYFLPRAAPRHAQRMLFLGTLSYGPNIDGLCWFVREVLPRIIRARPSAVLEVVGRDPAPQVRALAGPHVRIVGGVQDVREHLTSAALMVAPLRVGGGTRLKLVEALACRCPVVATATAAEGLALEDGRHLWLASSAQAFAAATLDALAHPVQAAARAARGRERCLERYTWPALAEQLLACWGRVASGTTPAWQASLTSLSGSAGSYPSSSACWSSRWPARPGSLTTRTSPSAPSTT